MMILPSSKKRFIHSFLELNIKCHNSSCLLFPSDFLIEKEGIEVLAGWSHIKEIKQWVAEIMHLIPKCGYSSHETDVLTGLWKLGQVCSSLILNAGPNDSDLIVNASRCFYAICIISWQIIIEPSLDFDMEIPGSIQPLLPALAVSRLETLWQEGDIDRTISNIEQFVAVLTKR